MQIVATKPLFFFFFLSREGFASVAHVRPPTALPHRRWRRVDVQMPQCRHALHVRRGGAVGRLGRKNFSERSHPDGSLLPRFSRRQMGPNAVGQRKGCLPPTGFNRHFVQRWAEGGRRGCNSTQRNTKKKKKKEESGVGRCAFFAVGWLFDSAVVSIGLFLKFSFPLDHHFCNVFFFCFFIPIVWLFRIWSRAQPAWLGDLNWWVGRSRRSSSGKRPSDAPLTAMGVEEERQQHFTKTKTLTSQRRIGSWRREGRRFGLSTDIWIHNCARKEKGGGKKKKKGKPFPLTSSGSVDFVLPDVPSATWGKKKNKICCPSNLEYICFFLLSSTRSGKVVKSSIFFAFRFFFFWRRGLWTCQRLWCCRGCFCCCCIRCTEPDCDASFSTEGERPFVFGWDVSKRLQRNCGELWGEGLEECLGVRWR